MTLDGLQAELVHGLRNHGLDSISAWPQERRKRADGPVVLVGLEKMSCSPAGLQDYLGQRLDVNTGQWEDLHGRRAQLVFTLDILAEPHMGMQVCREALDRVIRCVQTEKPAGLSVKELTGEEPEYDEKEELLKLRCRLTCEGWLCTAGEEAGTFLDFTLRGDVNA